jgi:hypothetical protein
VTARLDRVDWQARVARRSERGHVRRTIGTAQRSPGGNPLIQIGENENVAVDLMLWRYGSIE